MGVILLCFLICSAHALRLLPQEFDQALSAVARPRRGRAVATAVEPVQNSEQRSAVIMSGLLRTLLSQDVQRNIMASIIEPLQADTFLAISKDDNCGEAIESSFGKTKQICDADTVEKLLNQAQVLSQLAVVKWELVDNLAQYSQLKNQFNDSCKKELQPYTHFAQWNANKAGYQLMADHETTAGFEYYQVLRLRTDVVYNSPFPKTEWITERNEVKGHYFGNPGQESLLMDPWAALSREAATHYFNTIQQFDCTYLQDSRAWCHETKAEPAWSVCRLSQQMKQHNVTIKNIWFLWAMTTYCPDGDQVCTKRNPGKLAEPEPGWQRVTANGRTYDMKPYTFDSNADFADAGHLTHFTDFADENYLIRELAYYLE